MGLDAEHKNLDPNETEAFELYSRAASGGYLHALFLVRTYYEDRRGVVRKMTTAIEKYVLAAKRGHLDAMVTLGRHYEQGTRGEKDEAKAVCWYIRAAGKGDLHAVHLVGKCYENGTGVFKDITKAIPMYCYAAERGHLDAMVTLNRHYEQGTRVGKDEALALNWFKMAADNGDLHAVYLVGKCYENVTGVLKDIAEAIEFYSVATERAHLDAMVALGFYYDRKARHTILAAPLPGVQLNDVFLVHAGEQKWIAVDTMKYILEEEGNFHYFLDRVMQLGSPPLDQMRHALRTCRYVVVLLSRSFFTKKHAAAKLVYAFQRMRWIRNHVREDGWNSLRVVLFEMNVIAFNEARKSSECDLLEELCDEVTVSAWLGDEVTVSAWLGEAGSS